MVSDLDDKALVEYCIRRDRAAWSEFVQRFSKLVYWSIHQVFGRSTFENRRELVDDVYQEVFEKIFSDDLLARVKNVDSVKKYLAVLAGRLAFDKIRTMRRHEMKSVSLDDWMLLKSSEGQSREESSFKDALEEEASELFWKAFDGLTSRERLCMEWCIVDGKKHDEVALCLGISTNTVSSIVHRAKEKIRQFIQQGDQVEPDQKGFGT